jgi:DNA-binding NarL/FixJ family response regulator
MSGIECIRRLSPQLEATRFLVLTIYQDSETIFAALAAGAHGYLLKPVEPDELSNAVHTASSGGAPMTSAITRKLIDFFHHPGRNRSRRRKPTLPRASARCSTTCRAGLPTRKSPQ